MYPRILSRNVSKDVYKEYIQEIYLRNVSQECIQGTYSTIEYDLPHVVQSALITNS